MSPAEASARRIGAMVMRHVYVLRGSWPRLLELVYWPAVQMALWGLITRFLATESSLVAQAGGLFLSAVLLWDTLFRCQLGVSLTFMEEMWARNLGHLFVSPLRPHELVLSTYLVSLIRTLIGVGGAALLAIPLFDFWIVDELGLTAMIGYGAFLTAVINFLILAFVIFLLVKWVNKVMRRGPDAPAGPSEVDLLIEIRDELRKK